MMEKWIQSSQKGFNLQQQEKSFTLLNPGNPWDGFLNLK